MGQDTSLKIKNRRYIKSSSFVMALLFTILCGLVALSLGYFINYFAKEHFINNTEAILDSQIRYIEAVGVDDIDHTKQLYLFLNEDDSLTKDILSDISHFAQNLIVFDYPTDQQRYAAKIHTLKDGQKMLVGTNITAVSQDFKFMQWLGIASICFIMAVVFVSYLISIFVVSSTNKVANTALEIIDTANLSRRIELNSRWDDLSNMAAVLNMLLERIEQLMQGVLDVSDNIAHDLRTPLTRMRSKLEHLQEGPKKDKLLHEVDHLLDTFNTLLRISRIEAKKQTHQFSTLDLKKLLEDLIAFYKPLAEKKSIALKCDLSEVSVYGDRNLLFQAYANLFDNALKFTPQGGIVTINLYIQDHITYIEISDTGIGITEEDKEKIFDRFYRSQKSRTTPGTGLGLSLVKAVIELHNGSIQVENTKRGLKMITRL